MTRKTATGGQSLLISGALKMARGKRVPSNPNYYHPKLTTLENHTRELRAAIESHQHLLGAGGGGGAGRRERGQQVRDESNSDSSTHSISGFSSPISPSLQDSSPLGPGQATPITQTTDNHCHRDDQQHNNSNSKQLSLQTTSGKNKKLFPQKLWDLINDERYSFCLRWSDDGQLVYLNRDEFEDSYLKTAENQFHTQKAISFVRQMNMYGFRKVDDCYYENDNFKRGREHLLKNMTRKHPNKLTSASNSATSAADELAGAPVELPHFLYHKSMSGAGGSGQQQQQQQQQRQESIVDIDDNEHHQHQPLNLHRSQFIDQLQHLQHLQQQQRQAQQHQQVQQQQQSQVVDCTIQWLTILAAISYNLSMHVDNS